MKSIKAKALLIKISTILISILFAYLVALLITKKYTYHFKDVIFFEGLICLLFAAFPVIKGDLSFLGLKNNFGNDKLKNYVAEKEVSSIFKIPMPKNKLSLSASGLTLAFTGFALILGCYILP
jgi:hypothetical protein